MNLKSLFSCFILILSGAICVAQVPAKKTNLTAVDREAWRKVLRWPEELEQQWKRSRIDNTSNQGGLVFQSLGQDKYLVLINVAESSYQPGYVFMYYDQSSRSPTAARLLKLKTYERDDDDGHVSSKFVSEVEGLLTFDTAKKQLVVYTKGRGTGDCGSLVRYSITPRRAVPKEARVHACYDDYSRGVSDPLRWRKLRRL